MGGPRSRRPARRPLSCALSSQPRLAQGRQLLQRQRELLTRLAAHPFRGPRRVPDDLHVDFVHPRQTANLYLDHLEQSGGERAPAGGQDHLDPHLPVPDLDGLDQTHVHDADLAVPTARVVATVQRPDNCFPVRRDLSDPYNILHSLLLSLEAPRLQVTLTTAYRWPGLRSTKRCETPV